MTKKNKSGKITLAGGRNAHLVNPLGLVKQYKAVCVSEGVTISTSWRNTKAEATLDAAGHISKGHFIDYAVRII